MEKRVNTARIDQQIAKAKARLSELCAKRREIIAASKPPKRMSSDERRDQIEDLALAGASMETIVEKTQLSKATIRYHLWELVYEVACEELFKEGKDATEWKTKEFEVKKRLFPGIKWSKSSYVAPRYSWQWTKVPYVFGDGTIEEISRLKWKRTPKPVEPTEASGYS